MDLSSFILVIKAERISSSNTDDGYVFPDEDDHLTKYDGGNVQLMISSGLVQNISKSSNVIATYVCSYTYIATIANAMQHKLLTIREKQLQI